MSDMPTLRELVPVLRNARRRLLHGMSPTLLHAIQQATLGNEALFRGCAMLLYAEAVETGGFQPHEAGTSIEEMTVMFIAWTYRTGSSAAAGVMHRCVERIEAELSAPGSA